MQALPLQVFRLFFEAETSGTWRDFPGFVWRGALGNRLRRMSCVTGAQTCRGCPVVNTCAYGYVFETRPVPGVADGLLEGMTAAPHPFVLAPRHAWAVTAGELVALDVVVVGRGMRYAQHVLHSLQRCGEGGLGPERVRLRLQEVGQARFAGSGEWLSVYDAQGRWALFEGALVQPGAAPEQVVLTLLTPVRLRVAMQYLGVKDFAFAPFFSTLLRRISQLAAYHGLDPSTTDLDIIDYRHLANQAKTVDCVCKDLQWHDWRRFSSPQKKAVPMGGVTGQCVLQGEALEEIWPWLWLGQWLHVGKGAAMGLGGYRLAY